MPQKADGSAGGQVKQHIAIGPSRKFVRRIFSRGSWNLNGRFYGGWCQQVSEDWRSKIFINDEPTVEVDFKGLHVAILSQEAGHPIQGDPYELPENTLPGYPADLQRKVVKKLLLTAINAKDEKSAFASFRDGFPPGHTAKQLTNDELSKLLGAFTSKHPKLRDSLCSDQGIRLMNVDSRIAERVIDRLTGQGCPVLCLHDSFIVPYSRTRLLKGFMTLASREVVGAELGLDASALGLDEMTDGPLYVLQDFISWRQTPRCDGYLKRLKEHEELWGPVGSAPSSLSQDRRKECSRKLVSSPSYCSSSSITYTNSTYPSAAFPFCSCLSLLPSAWGTSRGISIGVSQGV